MQAVMSRLLCSKDSSSRSSYTLLFKNGRLLSTSSDKVNRASEVEEAETIEPKAPSTDKVLVLGGNGFVGSHVCKEAIKHGLAVSSFSRSGRSSLHDSWADNIVWHQGDLLKHDSLMHAMDGVTSVISCVGGFGSNSHMYKINGSANIYAINAAAEQGVKRFVYLSAADFGLINYVMRGYYEGKRATETELMNHFPYRGVILRPGFIYGIRQVGNVKLPLSIIGIPLEMLLRHAKPLTRIPFIGPLLTSPVHVVAVAKVAVRAALDPAFPPGILDVYDILHHNH